MKLTGRSLAATCVVGLLLGADGFAAWLGVSESPSIPGALSRFISDSRAEGTLAFQMTVRTVGVGTTERIRGVIDFADGDGSEVTETVLPHALPQVTESVVVGGAAYERVATDRAGGPRFDGPWQRVDAGISVPPFAPLAGTAAPLPVRPDLQRVADARVDGVATTMYQVASFGVTCPPGTGFATDVHQTTWLWVDGQGRVRRWENSAVVQFGTASVAQRATTVTTFSDFGLPVSVHVPAPVIGTATPAPKASTPYAGCLVTPG